MRGIILLIAAALVAAPAVVVADDDGERRVRGISEQQAIRIARGYGLAVVGEIENEDGGWEIEGRDHRGRKLEVKINARGRVTSVERGD